MYKITLLIDAELFAIEKVKSEKQMSLLAFKAMSKQLMKEVCE